MTRQEQLDRLFLLVSKMRRWQREHYTTHSREAMVAAKDYERRVDIMLAKIRQPRLEDTQ